MGSYDDYQNQVIEAGLWLFENGYFGSHRGTGGNVSVRIDEKSFAITPSSMKYQDLAADDIFILDLDLSIREGKDGLKPSVEAGLHSIVYRKRPDVNAVVHTHQTYGSVFAVINTPIPALFDEVAFTLGPTVTVVPYALSGSAELADNVGQALSNNANAYLIQNHGILALGKNLDRAILHAELLEKVAQIYCLALSTGKAGTTLPQSIVEIADMVRSDEVKKAADKK